MCHKCINRVSEMLIELIEDKKFNNSSLQLTLIAEGLSILTAKMKKTVVLDDLFNTGYVNEIDTDLLYKLAKAIEGTGIIDNPVDLSMFERSNLSN